MQVHFHLYKSYCITSYNLLLLSLFCVHLNNCNTCREHLLNLKILLGLCDFINVKPNMQMFLYAGTWKDSLLWKVIFFFVLGMQCLSYYGLELELYLLLEPQRETCLYITDRLLARFLFLVCAGLKLSLCMWKGNFTNILRFLFSSVYEHASHKCIHIQLAPSVLITRIFL